MAIQPPAVDPLEGHPRYKKLQYLSAGSYGIVVLAVDKENDDLVAVKFMARGQERITKNIEREILNHSSLVHPHVIRFREAFLTDDYLAIAMEYARGGDLYRYISHSQGLSEDHARWFYQQLILGLDYCHKKNISNRDIKLENTLLDDIQPNRRPLLKICDFGYSINENHSMPKTRVGTPGYTAPEVLTNRCRYDGKQADVWSSGVMLYAMLFCQYPFERPEDMDNPRRNTQIVKRITKGEYYFPPHKPVSAACKELLSRIFVVDPTQRITISEIWRHPWFRRGMPADLDIDRYNDHYLQITMGEQEHEATRRVLQSASLGTDQAEPRFPEYVQSLARVFPSVRQTEVGVQAS
eukprot:jgi/Botrbrau1/12168/Bobra.0186s0076.1